MDDLHKLYTGTRELPRVELSYADFAVWEGMTRTDAHTADLAYWKEAAGRAGDLGAARGPPAAGPARPPRRLGPLHHRPPPRRY